jgi:hypothetical protein
MSTAGTLYDETVGGGFAKLLNSTVISNGASLVGISLPVGYDAFLIDLESIFCTGQPAFIIRVSIDNGASWIAANYYWSMSTIFSNDPVNTWRPYGSFTLGDPHPTWLGWSHGFIDGYPLGGRVRVFPNSGANAFSTILFRYSCVHPTLYTACNVGSGWWPGGTAINAIAFLPSSSSFTSGTIRLYGMRKGT